MPCQRCPRLGVKRRLSAKSPLNTLNPKITDPLGLCKVSVTLHLSSNQRKKTTYLAYHMMGRFLPLPTKKKFQVIHPLAVKPPSVEMTCDVM